MIKRNAYNDYKSVWVFTHIDKIKDEIHVIKKYSYEVDKYLDKDQLTSEDKLDILNSIIKARG